MSDKLVKFKTAKLAKKNGFKYVCTNVFEGKISYPIEAYNNGKRHVDKGCYARPTLSQLQKWFRRKHKIHLTITSISQESWQCHITKVGQKLGENFIEDAVDYYDALESGIQKAFKEINNG